jgi:pimeloyl-ACP methyl ester carboxylesterase
MIRDRSFHRTNFVGAGGVNIVGDVGGSPSNPAVILLHGGGQTRHSWSAAMRAFVAAGYHVINLDARGHGESAWCPDGNYSVTTQSLDLRAVLKEVKSPCALVGASMGGATAMYAACTASEPRIKAVVLVDIVPTPSAHGVKRIKDFMHKHLDGFASVDEAIAAVAAYNPSRPSPPDPSGIRKNLRKSADGTFRWHWDPKLLKLDVSAESSALLNVLDTASRPYRIPTLLIRGMSSDVVLDDGIAELRKKIPQLEVIDVAGAGHMVAGDKNDVFNASVVGFLHRHLPPGSPMQKADPQLRQESE